MMTTWLPLASVHPRLAENHLFDVKWLEGEKKQYGCRRERSYSR